MDKGNFVLSLSLLFFCWEYWLIKSNVIEFESDLLFSHQMIRLFINIFFYRHRYYHRYFTVTLRSTLYFFFFSVDTAFGIGSMEMRFCLMKLRHDVTELRFRAVELRVPLTDDRLITYDSWKIFCGNTSFSSIVWLTFALAPTVIAIFTVDSMTDCCWCRNDVWFLRSNVLYNDIISQRGCSLIRPLSCLLHNLIISCVLTIQNLPYICEN